MDTSLYLAKLIGLYGLVVSVLLAVGGSSFRKQMESALTDAGFLLLSGILSLVAGLALVVGHNVWEASWRVAITLVGYLALLKGVVLLVRPDLLARTSSMFFKAKGSLVYVLMVAPLAAWLAWIGYSGG